MPKMSAKHASELALIHAGYDCLPGTPPPHYRSSIHDMLWRVGVHLACNGYTRPIKGHASRGYTVRFTAATGDDFLATVTYPRSTKSAWVDIDRAE